MTRRYTVPAVIVGGALNGLGVARSLAGAGVPVVMLDPHLEQPTMRTRHGRVRRIPSLTRVPVEGRDVIDGLLAVADELSERPVLMMTQEETVTFVSEQRQRLADRFHFTMPPHGTMLDLLDKTRFQARAETLGHPVPRSVTLGGLADLARARTLTYPCIAKPTTKHTAWGAHFKKAYRVAGFDELASIYAEIAPIAPDVIVQEWIEGGDADVYFCLLYRDAGARMRGSFTGRKIRQWPPGVGGTASCMPAPEAAAEVERLTARFFDDVGFVGLGSMEFKRDRRDGRFLMVEPTVGRTDFQEEVAALNGTNVPLAAYCAECGIEPPPPIAVRPPRIWRDPFGEANARAAVPDAVDPPEAAGHRVVDAYFRADDPGPWLAVKFDAVRRRFDRLFGRRS